MSEYKSSIVSIIGKPNVGKSTLLNRIVGQKISIVTPKSQTTRNIISGITTIDNAQIVFLDTPGIFEAKRLVDKSIVKQAWSSINSADFVLLLLDATEKLDEHFPKTLDKLKKANVRIIVGINKIDVKKNRLVEILRYLVDNDIKDVFQISASLGTGIDFLLKHIINNSAPSNWCYSEDEVTTLPMKFLSSEITREQVFLNLHEELPYNMIVETEDLKTLDDGSIKINQIIFVTTMSHKKMVLGKNGAKIKTIGMNSRIELEKIYERKIHLYLFVKIKDNLLDDPNIFNKLIYS
jgi:GTPase